MLEKEFLAVPIPPCQQTQGTGKILRVDSRTPREEMDISRFAIQAIGACTLKKRARTHFFGFGRLLFKFGEVLMDAHDFGIHVFFQKFD